MSSVSGSDSVFGHYIQQSNTWGPLLSESSALFRAVVEDDAAAVEAEIGAETSRVNAFYVLLYWGSQPQNAQGKEDANGEGSLKPAVTVKQRTLVMIAAFHGSMRVLSLLAVNGADPALVSPDGMTAYDLAYAGNHPNTPTIVAYLRDAENSLQVLRGQVDASKAPLAHLSQSGSVGLNGAPGGGTGVQQEHYRAGVWGMPLGRQDSAPDPFNADASPYSTAELTKPEYSTDDFRMFCFKVLRCCRRYAHDWRACPFAHPTENARRRDPREYRYCSIACPDYKQGFCIRGDNCPYAHGVFECWLHPSRYRSQLCKDGSKCRRPVCFFAHSLPELRTPSHTWVPTPEDVLSVPNGGTNTRTPYVQASQGAVLSPQSVPPPTTRPAMAAHMNLPPAPINVVVQSAVHTPGQCPGPMPASSPPSQNAGVPEDTKEGEQEATEENSGLAAPRMSNAFARKHGLNPKDNPIVNLQKMALAGHIVPPSQASTGKPTPPTQVLPISPSETAAPMMKGANRQRKLLKQANQATLEVLAMSMNNMSLNGTGSHGHQDERHPALPPGVGPLNTRVVYPERRGSIHSDIGPMANTPVASGGGGAVSSMGPSQYINVPHQYVTSSPGGAGGYLPVTPTAARSGMVGHPGAIGLHPGH